MLFFCCKIFNPDPYFFIFVNPDHFVFVNPFAFTNLRPFPIWYLFSSETITPLTIIIYYILT